MRWRGLFLAGLIGFMELAMARPLPTPELEALRDRWRSEAQSDGFNYLGIAELSNCSGSLVKFATSQPTDRALILTNGHCIGRFPPPGAAFYGVARERNFNLLDRSGRRSLGQVRSDILAYATMTKTDMAIYRLTQTYQQIQDAFGVPALELAVAGPGVGQAIEVLSGYWRRGYSCQVEKIVHQLVEGEWMNEQSIRYSQPGCEVIGGTSGSPILAAGSRTVVGVNNTGNEDGGRCTDNNPCEVDENGQIEYQQGRNYGQQTSWLYSCLNASREIDVLTPGCELPH